MFKPTLSGDAADSLCLAKRQGGAKVHIYVLSFFLFFSSFLFWLATEDQWQGCVWRICFTWVIRQRCELKSGEYHKRNITKWWIILHFALFWPDVKVTDYKWLIITHCIKSLLDGMVYTRFLLHLTFCMSWYSLSIPSWLDNKISFWTMSMSLCFC